MKKKCLIKKSDFTLTELLVTIGLIIFITGISIGIYSFANRMGTEAKAKSAVKMFEIAAESYKAKIGYYPIQQTSITYFHMDAIDSGGDDLNDFLELNSADLTTTGSLIPSSRGLWKDPWDGYYVYLNPGKKNPTRFDFYSAGADGLFGNEDDIANYNF